MGALREGITGSLGPAGAQAGQRLSLGWAVPAELRASESPAGPLVCVFTDSLSPWEAQENPWPEKPTQASRPDKGGQSWEGGWAPAQACGDLPRTGSGMFGGKRPAEEARALAPRSWANPPRLSFPVCKTREF